MKNGLSALNYLIDMFKVKVTLVSPQVLFSLFRTAD